MLSRPRQPCTCQQSLHAIANEQSPRKGPPLSHEPQQHTLFRQSRWLHNAITDYLHGTLEGIATSLSKLFQTYPPSYEGRFLIHTTVHVTYFGTLLSPSDSTSPTDLYAVYFSTIQVERKEQKESAVILSVSALDLNFPRIKEAR